MPKHCLVSLAGWWFLVGLALCGLSCAKGQKFNTVEGKVLLKNEPLAGALVTFHPKGGDDVNAVRPTGFTKEDGTFSVISNQETGAPTGDYVVTIICTVPVKSEKPKALTMGVEEETEDRLKGAYAERNASKISVTIKDGVNKLEPFNLE